MQIVLRNRRAVPSRLYDFIPIDPCCWRESGFWRRPAPFEQNEIPLKNSVESRDYAHPKVRGQNSSGFLLSHGCALFTAISIIGALCLPDRHRPDKPGDDVSAAATSFAPLTDLGYKSPGCREAIALLSERLSQPHLISKQKAPPNGARGPSWSVPDVRTASLIALRGRRSRGRSHSR